MLKNIRPAEENAASPPVSAGSADELTALALKAAGRVERQGEEIISGWLEQVIGDLELKDLESFPAAELGRDLPELLAQLQGALTGEPLPVRQNSSAAISVAALRGEKPSVSRLLGDFILLKRLVLEAVASGVRSSDAVLLKLTLKLEERFQEVLGAGLEAFVEQRSRELQFLANTDPLTGIYNVRYFRQQLHRNLEMYKRYRIPFALLMIDLDRLKYLNDAMGHGAGDTALRHLAAIMLKEKRETDIAVRYGGDEFYLLLPGTSVSEAEYLARRLTRGVRKLNLSSGGREMTGISVGIVSCPANGTDVSTLREKADRALYLAKSIGGDSVACYREFSLSHD